MSKYNESVTFAVEEFESLKFALCVVIILSVVGFNVTADAQNA